VTTIVGDNEGSRIAASTESSTVDQDLICVSDREFFARATIALILHLHAGVSRRDCSHSRSSSASAFFHGHSHCRSFRYTANGADTFNEAGGIHLPSAQRCDRTVNIAGTKRNGSGEICDNRGRLAPIVDQTRLRNVFTRRCLVDTSENVIVAKNVLNAARRRGQWDRSEAYFNDAERLDPRNVNILGQHAITYYCLRRFPEALRKLDQILNITPDDIDQIASKAAIAQAEGDLPRASALLAPLRPSSELYQTLQTQAYQAILERRAAPVIPRLKEILAERDPALGYLNGELRFWLGWAQEVAGDHAGAQESWRQARSELEPLLKEQPENFVLMGDLALVSVGLGDKTAALALSERAMTTLPIEKDALSGPKPLEILARVAAQAKEPDRAIAALEKLLSIPGNGALAENVPLTPALLRLDPMFDPLRNDPRFQKLAESPAPKTPDK
jgi:tetratricopeptide (TPR) repeat protein